MIHALKDRDLCEEAGDHHEPAWIEVRDLRFQVGDKQILKGASLGVAPGEILSVMGMSGSGKTTLLHCIGGLTAPTSGSIRIGDIQTVGMPEAELNRVRERMGMVFQYAALFDSLSVFENVAFGLRRRRHLPNDEIKKNGRRKAGPGGPARHGKYVSVGAVRRHGEAGRSGAGDCAVPGDFAV